MGQTIPQRLEDLRRQMQAQNIASYIIPSSDAHLGEYIPEHWKSRAWLSGFTGSAGTLLVTQEMAGLWTDSRYFLQAEEQLSGSSITLFKEGTAGTPSLIEYLTQNLPAGAIVGCDGACISQAEAEGMRKSLAAFDISLYSAQDLIANIWQDRPEIPTNAFVEHPVAYAGEATQQRTSRILTELKTRGANATIITTLDELAWTFNIRSTDVACNPVGVGFGFVGEKECILFTFAEKVSTPLREHLSNQGVQLRGYNEIFSYLQNISRDVIIWVDKARITNALYDAIPQQCRTIEGLSVITLLKSYKNEVELAGIRNCMVRDGVALTRFFKWLEEALAKGETPSEVEIDTILASYRAAHERYKGDSFDTICGYQDHGAIVHYRAQEATAYKLQNKGVLLLDSGAQYQDGTTDITRTIALGPDEPEAQLKTDFTLVLKGHIAIATAIFPEGTRGNQLDILARKALWDRALSYGHGTGHGVGCALNVHEGPQNIRTDNNPSPMAIGTFTSNEPGLYRAGKWGIRIENLIVTRKECDSEFGSFLGFETVTLCYLDNRLVDTTLLDEKEIRWYNDYQERVYTTLSPHLSVEDAAWLRTKTLPLSITR